MKRMTCCTDVSTGMNHARQRTLCPRPSGLSSHDDRLTLTRKPRGVSPLRVVALLIRRRNAVPPSLQASSVLPLSCMERGEQHGTAECMCGERHHLCLRSQNHLWTGTRLIGAMFNGRSEGCHQHGMRRLHDCTAGSFGGCIRLEPYAGKLAWTVLRGRGHSTVLLLPD